MESGLIENKSFRFRKKIHYSLLLCILLIQIVIAAFFYNEFIRKKKLDFIENQLQEINSFEKLTENSRKELVNSQDYFQKYLITKDKKFLDLYFESANKLSKNFDSINAIKNQNPKLKAILVSPKTNSEDFKKLKNLIDSTYETSSKSHVTFGKQMPTLKKYNFDTKLDNPVIVETEIYSDTTKKKKLMGRLGDALSGKENVRKESIVVTMKKDGKITNPFQMKNETDSIITTINNHYNEEVKKIQVNIVKNDKDSKNKKESDAKNDAKINEIFSNLIVYGNGLMTAYDKTIKDAKSSLEKEINKQNAKNNSIRNYLVFGAMLLMFIVSILLIILTRITFIYEQKLSSANHQIKENLKFKNRILGMLSHELRAPLKIIDIFIKRINKKTDDSDIKEYLKSISYTNNTLLMHSNQILEYTKNQQVENKLVPVVFNLKTEVQSILNSIQPYIETRNNELIVNENINSNIEVNSDNTKINQLFMNILGNANKFTENGKITVNCFTEKLDENTITLFTEISDTGKGISENDIQKIFEPYYQGMLSGHVENLGAGLGLSLCKEIVELYNGDISVSSEKKSGTTVKFQVNLNLQK